MIVLEDADLVTLLQFVENARRLEIDELLQRRFDEIVH